MCQIELSGSSLDQAECLQACIEQTTQEAVQRAISALEKYIGQGDPEGDAYLQDAVAIIEQEFEEKNV